MNTLALAIDRISEDAYPGAPCGACPKCQQQLTLLSVDAAKKSAEKGAHRGRAMCSACCSSYRVKIGRETASMRQFNRDVASAMRELDEEMALLFGGEDGLAV